MKEIWGKKRIKVLVGIIILVIVAGIDLGIGAGKAENSRKNTYIAMGEKYMDDLSYEQAIASYTTALQIDPSDQKCLTGLEAACMAYTEEVLQMSENNITLQLLREVIALCERSNLLLESERLEERIAELQRKQDQLEMVREEQEKAEADAAEKAEDDEKIDIYKWMILKIVYPGDVVYRYLEFYYINVEEEENSITFYTPAGKMGEVVFVLDKQTEQAVVTQAVFDALFAKQTTWEGDEYDFTITDKVKEEWNAYKEREELAYIQRGRYKVKAIKYLEENWPGNQGENSEPGSASFGDGAWGNGIEDFSGEISYKDADGKSSSYCNFYLTPESERMEIISDLGSSPLMQDPAPIYPIVNLAENDAAADSGERVEIDMPFDIKDFNFCGADIKGNHAEVVGAQFPEAAKKFESGSSRGYDMNGDGSVDVNCTGIAPEITITYFDGADEENGSHYDWLVCRSEHFLYGNASAYKRDDEGNLKSVSPARFDIAGFSDSPITTGDTYSDWSAVMQVEQIKEKAVNMGDGLIDRYELQTQWGPAIYREGMRKYDNMKICQMDIDGEENWHIRAYFDEAGVISNWTFFY